MRKLRIAVRRARFFSSRWLLAPPKPLPADYRSPEPSRMPLLMVSQVQRSGGSMFAQLLDGHPELQVCPGEMHIAKPKRGWPRVDPGQHPSIAFRKLVDHRYIESARLGFKKSVLGRERLPFDYDVGFHQSLFCALWRQHRPSTQREILDLFFTSFFATWNWNREGLGDKVRTPRRYCGFAAGFAANEDAVARYFRDYPDGHLVSIVRHPRNWLPSALNMTRSRRKFIDTPTALATWQRSALGMDRNARRFPGKVTIVEFSSLIAETRAVMERLFERLGLGFDPALLTPTFEGVPVESNGSFHTVKGFVDSSVLARDGGDSPEMGRCVEIYEQLRAISLCPEAAVADDYIPEARSTAAE